MQAGIVEDRVLPPESVSDWGCRGCWCFRGWGCFSGFGNRGMALRFLIPQALLLPVLPVPLISFPVILLPGSHGLHLPPRGGLALPGRVDLPRGVAPKSFQAPACSFQEASRVLRILGVLLKHVAFDREEGRFLRILQGLGEGSSRMGSRRISDDGRSCRRGMSLNHVCKSTHI